MAGNLDQQSWVRPRADCTIADTNAMDGRTSSGEGSGHSWEDVDELNAGLPTSFNAPRNQSLVDFDRQKHLNACQLLNGELNKMAETVAEPADRTVIYFYMLANYLE